MAFDTSASFWGKIAEASDWPTIVLLKDADKRILPNFPFSRGHIRNLFTGREKNQEFAGRVFCVGRYKAMLRDDLVDFLNQITKPAASMGAGQ